jgi:hypothetical protein
VRSGFFKCAMAGARSAVKQTKVKVPTLTSKSTTLGWGTRRH